MSDRGIREIADCVDNTGAAPGLRIAGVINGGTGKATSTAETSVAASTSSVTLLAVNTDRKFATLRNSSTSNAYISKSAAATTGSAIELLPGDVVTFDDYTGIVTGIWVTANGTMRIAEGV